MACNSSQPALHYNPRVNAVRVRNFANGQGQKIVKFLEGIAGPVQSSRELRDMSGNYLEVVFFNKEATVKALGMSGYVLEGHKLVIEQSHLPLPLPLRLRPDDRRNLYVLGIPFALTKQEFAEVFSPYGTVSHCVILATVDNSSRRRGFVVMSSHQEAILAMSSLTRTQLKGHSLDISWAVVQRSRGFLDGGDRTTLLDPGVSTPHDRVLNVDTASSSPHRNIGLGSLHSSDDLRSLVPSATATSTLLVTNLPTIVFSDLQDLRALLCPFGGLKRLEILEVLFEGVSTILVEFESPEIADEASSCLQMQCYGNRHLQTSFARFAPNDFWSDNPYIGPFDRQGGRHPPSPRTSDRIHATQRPLDSIPRTFPPPVPCYDFPSHPKNSTGGQCRSTATAARSIRHS